MSEEGLSESSVCERCCESPCECSDPGRVDPWTGRQGLSTAEQVEGFLPDKLFVSNHQPEEDIWVPTEAEKDVAKRTAIIRTAGKAPKASKRERSPPPPRRVARLDTFFDQYDTPLAQRVTMCRAYASFVASTLPKKQKK